MDSNDYKELDRLLGKLSLVLGSRFCIIPEHIQDLAYIAVYDHDGKPIKSSHGVDIEDAVKKLTNEK